MTDIEVNPVRNALFTIWVFITLIGYVLFIIWVLGLIFEWEIATTMLLIISAVLAVPFTVYITIMSFKVHFSSTIGSKKSVESKDFTDENK